MNDSPCNAADWQPSPDFHRSTPILELPAEHVSVLHGRATAGHVAIATLDPGWTERAIPVEDLPRYLDALPLGVDVYVSQARFHGWRRTQLLATLNACWLDVDFYHEHPDWSARDALYNLLRLCAQTKTPAPSYVLGSGRGLAAIWLVEVHPRDVLPRWRAVQEVLLDRFRALGLDTGASRDVARVLRLAGTLNTRAEPAQLVRVLYPDVGSPEIYGFEALCAELLPVGRPDGAREPSAPQRRSGARVAPLARSSGSAPRSRPSSRVLRLVRACEVPDARLWGDRLHDLDWLRESRWFGELPPGQRDYWMLLAGTALSWIVPATAVRREVRMLGIRAIGGDWGERALESRLASVLSRAEAAARGERVEWQGVEFDPRYRYRNATIVDLLQITLEEQRRGMRTLIGPEERERRYRENQSRRGALGGRARAEKVWEENRERDAEIVRLRLQGRSLREIAGIVGIGKSAVDGVLGRFEQVSGVS